MVIMVQCCVDYHTINCRALFDECRETKPKVITTTNQKKRDTVKSQRELKAKKRLKRGKTRATKSSYVIAFLHLIG